MANPLFRSAFSGHDEEASGSGKRPVVFDILGPDWETSLLPTDMWLVLHVNPSSMSVSYNKEVTRIQTKGGFVEQHWGDSAREISFDMATGAFMRLYTGLSNITNPGYLGPNGASQGTRRETIAYDKYLDMLALFKNNGSIYDGHGNIVLQGQIKVTFDGGVYFGWFTSFSVTESAEKPYQFALNAQFSVEREIMTWRSHLATSFTESTETSDESVEIGQWSGS